MLTQHERRIVEALANYADDLIPMPEGGVSNKTMAKADEAISAAKSLLEQPPIQVPELTDFEHSTLQAIVKAYGGEGVAALAMLMQADVDEEEGE